MCTFKKPKLVHKFAKTQTHGSFCHVAARDSAPAAPSPVEPTVSLTTGAWPGRFLFWNSLEWVAAGTPHELSFRVASDLKFRPGERLRGVHQKSATGANSPQFLFKGAFALLLHGRSAPARVQFTIDKTEQGLCVCSPCCWPEDSGAYMYAQPSRQLTQRV